MIKSWKHEGLKTFFLTGSTRGIMPHHAKRLRLRLRVIDIATSIEEMDVVGFRLHPLKGDRKGIWSMTVSGNWRLTFAFADGEVHLLNYEDYH